jgi:thioredoxin 1
MFMGLLDKIFKRGEQAHRPRNTSADTWENDILENPLPVVVDFWASWCAPCQVMSGLVDDLAREYAGRAEFFKLNIEHDEEIAANFSVLSVPTLIMFYGGEPVAKVTGLLPLNTLRENLDHVIARAGRDQTAGQDDDKPDATAD